MNHLRLFIGVPITGTAADRLEENGRSLIAMEPSLAPFRWIPPSNYHITLQFLGQTDAAQVTDLKQLLEDVADILYPFEWTLDRWRELGSGRLVAAGDPSSTPAWSEWPPILQRKLAAIGFEPEKRTYFPHVTTARSRTKKPLPLKTLARATFVPITVRVGSLALYQSSLKPTGSRYTILSEYSASMPSSPSL